YIELDPASGALSIRGGPASRDDTITVQRSGNEVLATVKFDARTFTGRFDANRVKSVRVDAGGGNDMVKIDLSITLPTAVDGGAGNATVLGGAGRDVLTGGDGNDLLQGGAGADELRGGGGDDILRGGEGGDTLLGDAGADELSGGNGDDRLFGG